MAMVSRLVKRCGPYGFYALARFLCRRQPRILMYHRFSETHRKGFASREVFREQVAHIRRYYQPLTLRDMTYALFEEGRVLEDAVVLTIDDGYRDFYDIAYPILREYGVPATFFVTTGFVNGDLWLWHDQVEWLLEQVDVVEDTVSVGEVIIHAGPLPAESKDKIREELNGYLLSINDYLKHSQIARLADALGVSLPTEPPNGYEPCSWGQLREMEAAGIEIGGHTTSHPSLGRVSEGTARNEIFGSMTALRSKLGDLDRSFCYPNGQLDDVTPTCQRFVNDAGFVSATLAFPDSEGVRNRFALRRHVSGDEWFQFAKAVSGVELLGHKLRSGDFVRRFF